MKPPPESGAPQLDARFFAMPEWHDLKAYLEQRLAQYREQLEICDDERPAIGARIKGRIHELKELLALPDEVRAALAKDAPPAEGR